MRGMSLLLAALCLLLIAPAATAQTPQPVNLGFEDGPAGESPPGWFLPVPGFSAVATADGAQEGKLCLAFAPVPDQAAPFGNIMQAFDATPFRGKHIVFEGWVRCQAPANGAAQLWLRVDRPGGKMGFFDNMGDRPIHDDQWKKYQISGDIAPDAQVINIGLMIRGGAAAWADGLAITVTGQAGAGNQRPRTVTDRGMENLVALARLSGYIRFFHPSTESAGADWDSIMIAAVEAAEPADSPAALAAALESVFRPIAPSIRVWAGGPGDAPAADPPPQDGQGLVAYRHIGVCFKPSPDSPYTSTRVSSSPGAEAQSGIPAAGTCIVKPLGGGVSCRVPVVLYTRGDATWPAAQGPAPVPADRPAGWRATGDDRSTRLAAVMLAWNVIEHFYPYPEALGVDWQTVLPDALRQAAIDPDAAAFGKTLRVLSARTNDGHGGVTGPADDRAPPLDLDWIWAGDDLVVTRAPLGNAATGLAVGDIVVSIEGVPVADCYARVSQTISAATEQWRRVRALYELKTLPTAPTATVIARRSGPDQSRPVVAVVPRARTQNRHADGLKRPMSGAEIAPGIVYFDLVGAGFDDLARAMDRLGQARGIIFDVRGYPGEAGAAILPFLTDQTIYSARWMLPVVTLPDHEGLSFQQGQSWVIEPKQPPLTRNTAFLTDGEAISYAESCMGIVEAYKLGEIIGGPTAGTNGNINPVPLPGGYTMIYTGMQVLKQDGSPHHGVGIRPTIPCQPTAAGIAAGRDELLDKAVEVLGQRVGAPAK